MPIVIDGYNLLNVTGIVGRGIGPGSLQRSRLALLNFLAASIDPKELPHTTIVFDAHDPPPGLPRVVRHRGMTVSFAAKQQTADELIATLICENSAPRRLVVVSSDHEVQRAARRRRAKPVDSDVWYAELIRARRRRDEAAADEPEHPAVPLLEEDVNYWLRQFGGESELSTLWRQEVQAGQPTSREPFNGPDESSDRPLENPFPPGYGEDLLREL
jgi:uncharacterized protein